jgi:hypothetical protein
VWRPITELRPQPDQIGAHVMDDRTAAPTAHPAARTDNPADRGKNPAHVAIAVLLAVVTVAWAVGLVVVALMFFAAL